jgi:hypothetical protein
MSDDTPRPVATDDDKHTLTIEQVADRYASAGHARTVRTLQRYCKSGHLDCFKVPTLLGDEYRVTPESVERHLEQIREISATTSVATSRDQPRPVATEDAAPTLQIDEPVIPTTRSDTPRLVATDDDSSRYVAHLENENEFLRGQISVKDSQIETSNKQIAALTERVGESNKLFLGFQQLLGLRSTSKKDEKPPPSTADEDGSNL